MDSKVGLKKYISLGGKWRFVPILWLNGKPSPGTIIVDGTAVKHTGDGTFYLDWREGGKRIQKPCGKSSREALDAWRTKSLTSPDEEQPGAIADEPNTSWTIDKAIEEFLRGIKGTKAKATQAAYARDLNWFRKHCPKTFVAQVTRADLLDVFTAGRMSGANQKTINRRVMVGLRALRNSGSSVTFVKGDWPKTSDADVEVYEEEEVVAFLAACSASERVIFTTFLASGLRSGELATLCWTDVDHRRSTLQVREKPELNFKPKNHERRSVTVPRVLIDVLRAMERTSTSRLVFPTPAHPTRKNYGGDGRNAHHLELCKEIAFRAGLNCGRCVNSHRERCAHGPTCERWYLHKFRATYATEHLRSGMDLTTLRDELGHKDLKSVERYLGKLHQSKVGSTVESSSIARMVS